jgi:LysM repeat protein
VTGDNLWNISRKYGVTLSELRNLNPHIKGDLIRPGDVLNTAPQYKNEMVDVRAERARETGLDSLGAIRGFKHQGNYVLVDKKNNTLTVFDKNNN